MLRQARFNSASVSAGELSPGMHAALAVFLHAADQARQLGCDVWDFARGITRLWAAGISDEDLRFLVVKGLAVHAQETSSPKALARCFRKIKNLSLPEKSCFVLTENGEKFARSLPRPANFRPAHFHGPHGNGNRHLIESLPEWRSSVGELWLADVLLKRYKREAPMQRLILTSFQEQGWISRTDDPLPPTPNCEAKQRLHDTIVHLNRGLLVPLIRFSGDGTGMGIRWEFTGNTHVSAVQAGQFKTCG